MVTQPHRLGAISSADRTSLERREELGTSVGYSVQLDNVFPRPYGSILFCTAGSYRIVDSCILLRYAFSKIECFCADIFLRKLEQGLKDVSHIVVDGLHERDVNTDLLFVILRDMVPKYPDVRVIFMSVPAYRSIIKKHLSGCPSIKIHMKWFQFCKS